MSRIDDRTMLHWRFIKIDVEGMELEVLRGGTNTIECCRPVIMLELNDGTLARRGVVKKEVLDWMKDRNYKLELTDVNYGLDWPHTDVFFIPL